MARLTRQSELSIEPPIITNDAAQRSCSSRNRSANQMDVSSIIKASIDVYRNLAFYEDHGYVSSESIEADSSEISNSITFETRYSKTTGLTLSWFGKPDSLFSRIADSIEICTNKKAFIKVKQKVRKTCSPEQALTIAGAGGGGDVGLIIPPLLLLDTTPLPKPFSLHSVTMAKLDGIAIVDDLECYRVKVLLSNQPWVGTYFISQSDFLIRKFESQRKLDIPKEKQQGLPDDLVGSFPKTTCSKMWFKDLKTN